MQTPKYYPAIVQKRKIKLYENYVEWGITDVTTQMWFPYPFYGSVKLLSDPVHWAEYREVFGGYSLEETELVEDGPSNIKDLYLDLNLAIWDREA